jgi:hypothetical protein
MQDCCLGFIPYCFSSVFGMWSINSCFIWDFNSVATCSIACISAGVTGGHASKILVFGFGGILASTGSWASEWPVTGVTYSIGWLADGATCCVLNWLEIVNWFRSVYNNCVEYTCGNTGCLATPWLIGCWGEDLVWASVLAGVKTACSVIDCWGGTVRMGILSLGCCCGAVCTGIPSIVCWADLWGGVGSGLWDGIGGLFSVDMTMWAWAGLILTLSKFLLPWLK